MNEYEVNSPSLPASLQYGLSSNKSGVIRSMRKWLIVALAMVLPVSSFAVEKLDKLILSGPFSTVSNPLIHMVESGALKDVANDVEFVVWRNPDQMRALALSSKADFMAAPTNVAANLYNKGAELKLLNVSTWGILWMVSRDDSMKTLADFKGKDLVLPFRGDMPDIIFRELVTTAGLDPDKDFNLQYVPTPIDAMQMLIKRRADHVLLAEPAISMALRKTKSFPLSVVAPDIYRSADLTKEWQSVFGQERGIPQAGIAQVNNALDTAITARFLEEHKKATAWVKSHPKESGKEVAKHIKQLQPVAVADSISVTPLIDVPAREAKKELEHFFEKLMESDAKLIGGKLPDDGFYYSAE